jgi:hypothetical protein
VQAILSLTSGRNTPKTFSAVLLHPQDRLLHNLDSLSGRRVGIRGIIKVYKGQVEILVQTPNQILLLP